MPIIIPNNLPAAKTLMDENIFLINEKRAVSQDIRPLRIAILNLMPTKIETETQLLRLIGNTPLQVEVVFLHTETYKSKNISQEHLYNFYKTFQDVKHEKFDGMIITGAPIENLDFEDVEYWSELEEIMEYTVNNVTSTLHICWGAQAALYYHYHIPKYTLDKKIFGVFPHSICRKNEKLLRGFDEEFYVPHSRYTEVREEDIKKVPNIKILSQSKISGVYITASIDGKQLFVTGHSEYDPFTLKNEYERDILKGINIDIPPNYFFNDNPENNPVVRWKAHANLLFSNWLNYYVYQETPYALNGNY